MCVNMADTNKEQTAADKLREALCYAPTQAAQTLSEEEIAKADAYCEEYKAFIDAAKTEREAVEAAHPGGRKRRASSPLIAPPSSSRAIGCITATGINPCCSR